MKPDRVRFFFMPLIQLLSDKMRNTNILIPIYFHLLFNNLGLTELYRGLRLAACITHIFDGTRS